MNENDTAEIDEHFARFIARFGGGEAVQIAAKHLSHAVRLGHICLDLTVPPPGSDAGSPWPAMEEWRRELGLSRAVGGPGTEYSATVTPLVLDHAGRLYLRRYYDYEQALATALRNRSTASTEPPREGQEAAIKAALTQRLTVISGGPGTGKTTTVVGILQPLLEQDPTIRIALAAPTGKAAARLEQAVRSGFGKLPGAASQWSQIPRAATLHRLLGSRRNNPGFRHNVGNPLALDVLVVDEASMVPLPLMAKLFDALPENARVILLGDRDQLASVEPGSVLADIAEAAQLSLDSPLHGALVMLRKNFRFGNESAIFQLCEAVRAGDSEEALRIALNPAWPDLGSAPLPAAAAIREHLRKPVTAGYAPYLSESDPAKALAAFNQFRILCAVRRGPYGVEQLNRQIEAVLREAELLQVAGIHYAGMPILITRNDYQLNLFNGDIGILLPDPTEPETPGARERPLWAWFPGESAGPGADGAEAPALRKVSPSRLPEHEPAYAMTIHKSQGSEFERVLLLLPERDIPILTRELVYTGLTRARERVDIWFNNQVFEQGVARRTQRASGLRDALVRGPLLHCP